MRGCRTSSLYQYCTSVFSEIQPKYYEIIIDIIEIAFGQHNPKCRISSDWWSGVVEWLVWSLHVLAMYPGVIFLLCPWPNALMKNLVYGTAQRCPLLLRKKWLYNCIYRRPKESLFLLLHRKNTFGDVNAGLLQCKNMSWSAHPFWKAVLKSIN